MLFIIFLKKNGLITSQTFLLKYYLIMRLLSEPDLQLQPSLYEQGSDYYLVI